MQPSTFTQPLLWQDRFFTCLLPLLALFVGLGASQTALAQGAYVRNNITISASPTGGTPVSTTYTGRGTGTPKFDAADLGSGTSFDQNTGSLIITAATARLFVAGPGADAITASSVFYRVFLTGATTLPSFVELPFTLTSPDNTNNPILYGVSNSAIDLLTQPTVLGGGNYTVEIIYQSTVNDDDDDDPATPGDVTTSTITDPGNVSGLGYRATFTVIAPTVTPAGGTTTWVSNVGVPLNGFPARGVDTDWTKAANWSNGVPTRDSNAIIPGHGPSDPPTNSPLLNNPAAMYEVQDLTLQNANNNERALVRLGQSTGGSTLGATLRIYGNLDNLGGGLLASVSGTNGSANPLTNSTVVFAGDASTFVVDGDGNQVLTGGNQIVRGATTVVDIAIEGTGIKGVVNNLIATNTFTFSTTTAIVRTVFDDGALTLNTSITATVDLRNTGMLFGETNTAYIEGVTRSDRPLANGVTQTFGNIGVDITPDRDIPAPNVFITRTIGAPFLGPVGPNGASIAVKRQYGVSGDVNNSTRSTVVFHYLDSTDELNGNDEADLVLFRTTNNGVPFGPLGGTVNLAANTVTQTNVASINTITVADKDKPLPVTLTAFDAKRAGVDASITWATASETNSKGFNVQVSTDGKEFRTIGFVASATPTSTRATTYQYLDTEKNKTGVRYYRLQQVDLDDKTSYFAPRAVSFDGKADKVSVTAYPNPFTNEVRLSLPSSVEGKSLVRITDMTGRTVAERKIVLTTGTNNVEFSNLSDLKTGLYLVNITLPSGEVQNVKVLKQ